MSLEISRLLLTRIREHGKSAYPQECCGLLVGKGKKSSKSVINLKPVKNSREDSLENRYLISPQDLLAADKEARQSGLDIVGVYHSHPDHPARPSEFDREHAFPWYSYIIVSVAGGKPEDLTVWTLRDDRSAFDSEELLTTD